MGLSNFFRAIGEQRASHPKRGVDFYESQYQKELEGAFAGNTAQRKFLIYAAQLYNENRFSNALTVLHKLRDKCRAPADYRAVLLFTALNYTGQGDRNAAIAAYRELLNRVPQYSTAWSNLGQLYRKEGLYGEAVNCYRKAIDCDGENPYPYVNLAVVYTRMDAYSRAIPCAKRALELKNNLYQAAAVLAMCYSALGEEEEANRYYSMALRLGEKKEDLDRAIANLPGRDMGGPGIPEELTPVLQEWSRRTAIPVARLSISGTRKGIHQIGGPSLGPAPLDSQGKPMRLLCALRCEELRNLPDFPEKGLLRFYIADNANLGVNRHSPTEQTDFRVLYTETEEGLERQPEPAPSETFPVAWGCEGSCYLGTDAMPMEDYRFHERFNALLQERGKPPLEEQPEYVVRAIGERMERVSHKIGGYPCFDADDPRRDPRYAKYDVTLLQILSHQSKEHHVNIHFGRGGNCNFFIPRDNLRARDFSDVLYWWDDEPREE